jgi:uncharacterized protein YjbI with pentapeptide repeats
MANEQHAQILKQGVLKWNQWRADNPKIRPDLRDISFRMSSPSMLGIDLSEANFRDTDLQNCDLYRAWLVNADFSGAKLEYAGFGEATLGGAKFVKAELQEANFMKAHLFGADFTEAKISGSKFYAAFLEQTIFNGQRLVGEWFEAANLKDASLIGANLSSANLRGSNLQGADLRNAMLCNADLRGARLIDTQVENTDFGGALVYGASVWSLNGIPKSQEKLRISSESEAMITVDNLEVAQFIYSLLKYEKLRDVFNSVSEKAVLILGRFGGGGLEILHAIASKLREMQYLPIIFDFERPQDRNYTETIKTLVGLSRFVIVDLSGPSVPQELYSTVPHFKIPFVPIIEGDRKVYAMFTDFLEYPWVVKPPFHFTNENELLELLPEKVIEPAEARCKERRKLLKELFGR